MLLLGVNGSYHDSAAVLMDDYALLAAVSLERLTRRKGDGQARLPDACIDEVLRIAAASRGDVDVVCVSRGPHALRYFNHLRGGRWLEQQYRLLFGREKPKDMAFELRRVGLTDAKHIFDDRRFLSDHGFSKARQIHFYNHHAAHALPALFFTDWNDALLYTADGGGDNVNYSHRLFKDGELKCLFGDDRWLTGPPRFDSLGLLYGLCTVALGFKINRHEGKLVGLSALGTPSLYDAIAPHFGVDGDGRIHSDFPDRERMRAFVSSVTAGVAPADVAASVQKVLEDFVLKSAATIIEKARVKHLGVSGGVFSNVKLNRLLADSLPIQEIFVFPAMADDGLPVGGILEFLLERDGIAAWLKQRYRLETLYLGGDFDQEIDGIVSTIPDVSKVGGNVAEQAAALLANGQIGAIYTDGMEYGPRALGARSILADPRDANMTSRLNDRLERSEYMPFGPVVLDDHAEDVFDLGRRNAYAARFMTITCDVREEWRSRVPAIVHVDNSARPQVIDRVVNPLYYDILQCFHRRTGIPVLINTSFNVHEEPIVYRPAECARALKEGRIDFVASKSAIYLGKSAAASASMSAA